MDDPFAQITSAPFKGMGAPGTTATDIREGTDTEEKVAVKSPKGGPKFKPEPMPMEDPFKGLVADKAEDPFASIVHETKAKEESARRQSVAETFVTHGVVGVPAAAGALVGAETGAALGTMVFPGAGTVVGGILGAIGGGIASSMAVRELSPDSLNKYLDEGSKQNPVPAFTGDVASFGGVSKLGAPSTIKAAATLAGAGGGLETGREILSDEKLDPVKISIAAITTPMFGGDKTKLGKVLTGETIKEKLAASSKNTDTPEDLVKDLTQTKWEPPKEYNGIPIREGKTKTGATAQFDMDKKEIVLDRDKINEQYEKKNWTKSGLSEDTFKSPEEFAQFVLAHEEEHTLQSFEQFKEQQDLTGIGGGNSPVTLDDTSPPKYLYHGTRTDTKYLLDKDGNLVLQPAENFGGRTTSISLTHNLDFANDYAAREKGGGPFGFSFRNAKVIKVHSKSLPEGISRESGEEWAFNTDKPITISKDNFEIIDHPLAKQGSFFSGKDGKGFRENPEYPFMDWARDNGKAAQDFELDDRDPWTEENREEYLEETWGRQDYTKMSIEQSHIDEFRKKEVQKLVDISEQRSSGTYKEPSVEWDSNINLTDAELKTEYERQMNIRALEKLRANGFEEARIDVGVPDNWKTPEDFRESLSLIKQLAVADKITLGQLAEKSKAEGLSEEEIAGLRLDSEGISKETVSAQNRGRETMLEAFHIQDEIRAIYEQDPTLRTTPKEERTPAQKELAQRVYKKYVQIDNIKNDAERHRKAKDSTPLTEKQKTFKDKYLTQIEAAHKDLVEYGVEEGIVDREQAADHLSPRELEQPTKEKKQQMKESVGVEGDPSLREKINKWIDDFIGDRGDFNADVNKKTGAAKGRALYTLVDETGHRKIVQHTKDGHLIEWAGWDEKAGKYRVKVLGKTPEEIHKAMEGHTLGQASVEELEHASPYRYNKNFVEVKYKKYAELREQVRAYEAIKKLKESPEFEKIAHKISSGTEMPEGFSRPRFLDKLPALEGYAFDTKVSEIISDFARVRKPNIITRISGVLIQNMMLDPLMHMFNEGMHLFNARGLTGWVTPAGVARFSKYSSEAIRTVLSQDKTYTDIIKAGGQMLAPSTRPNSLEHSLYQKGLREFARDKEFKELAKSLAMTPIKLYKSLSKASSKAMWITRDIMYTQYILESKEHKQLSLEDAVKKGGRHMPEYILPSRVGEKVLGATLSRNLSTTLNNPNISVFSRYHYGLTKSMIETAKDVGAIRKGKEGLQQFKEGLDTLAAITVALAVLYPLMDMVAQKLTGNDNAEQRRAGPYHFMDAVWGVSQGTKEPQAILASVFTFNPAILALAQLGVDRQLYNGQPIYHATDEPEQIASDIGSYAAKQLPSVSTSLRAGGDMGGGTPQFAASLVDIKSPTEKQVERIDKIRNRDIRASEIRAQKRKLREYFDNK